MSRGETSLYLQICIIGLNVADSKKIRGLERPFRRQICPVIIDSKFRNYLVNQKIKLSGYTDPDIADPF